MQGQTPEQHIMYGLEKKFEDAAGNGALTPFQKLGIMRYVIGQMQEYAANAFQNNPDAAILIAEYIVCFLGEHAKSSKLLSEVFEAAGEEGMYAILQSEIDALFDSYAGFGPHLTYRR